MLSVRSDTAVRNASAPNMMTENYWLTLIGLAERGDRAPAGRALVLLKVIAKDHKTVMRACRSGFVRVSPHLAPG